MIAWLKNEFQAELKDFFLLLRVIVLNIC